MCTCNFDVCIIIIQHKNHWEIRQREEEIAELQKALSDMQVSIIIQYACAILGMVAPQLVVVRIISHCHVLVVLLYYSG